MFFRSIMAASIGVGAVLSASTQTTQAAEKWTCNIFVGPKHYVNKALKPWRKAVQKSTNGELKINYLPTSAAPPPKQIDGIAAGTFDCAFIFHAFTAKSTKDSSFTIIRVHYTQYLAVNRVDKDRRFIEKQLSGRSES